MKLKLGLLVLLATLMITPAFAQDTIRNWTEQNLNRFSEMIHNSPDFLRCMQMGVLQVVEGKFTCPSGPMAISGDYCAKFDGDDNCYHDVTSFDWWPQVTYIEVWFMVPKAAHNGQECTLEAIETWHGSSTFEPFDGVTDMFTLFVHQHQVQSVEPGNHVPVTLTCGAYSFTVWVQ